MEDNNKILIYTDSEGLTKIDVKLEDETLWLTQAQMCELYQTSKSNVSEHIKHIFEEGELQEDSVVRKFRTTASDGKSYMTAYYNLDMIIALGYRIRSIIATRFRQWATQRLKEYMIKGFALDDERLKQLGGGGYWKELLERIRDIRATEKVLYRQVLEIYATSIDYDPRASVSQEFFKKVQNKIHYAIHGHTAAKLIVERADAEKDFMGLLTFKGNQPTLTEARTAKNYLDEKELRVMVYRQYSILVNQAQSFHLTPNTPANISISLWEIPNRVANSRHPFTASITSEIIFSAVFRLSI